MSTHGNCAPSQQHIEVYPRTSLNVMALVIVKGEDIGRGGDG